MSGGVIFKEIHSERITLRPINDTDCSLYSRLYGDDNLLRYINADAIHGDKLQHSFNVALSLSQQSPCKRCFLVVELLETKEKAGIIGVSVLEKHKRIEVGVIFDPVFQTKHLAFNAFQLLIPFIRTEYSQYDIVADIDPNNRAAVWLALRSGFSYNPQSLLYEFQQ